MSADDPDELEASVLLRPVGSSVSGKVKLTDDGSGVTVKGKAEGLDPAQDYFSLFYDILSASTGPKRCIPGRVGNQKLTTDDAAFINKAEMGEPDPVDLPGIAAFPLAWSVNSDGDGSLEGTVDDVGLDRIKTISIRKCEEPGANCDLDGDVRVACGLIVLDD